MYKILIADQSNIVQHMLEANFVALGYDVRSALNWKELNNYLKYDEINMIIMDMSFPAIKLECALVMIRENYPDTRIIVLFKAVTIKEIVSMVRFGADECISKPINLPELNKSIGLLQKEEQTYKKNLSHRRRMQDDNYNEFLYEVEKSGLEGKTNLPEDAFLLHEYLKRCEHDVIRRALEKFSGHQKRTADYLGLSERSLRYKIKEMEDDDK